MFVYLLLLFQLANPFQPSSVIKDIETDYDYLYHFKSEKRDIEQRLYIKLTSEKECEFKLVIVRENCDDAIQGKATLKNGDSELDEDAGGEAYPVDEYYSDLLDHEVFLRIANDREKAKIVLVPKKNTQNSCTFVNEQLMYAE